MNDLVSKGFSKSRSSYLTGIARSMIYYEHRKRKPQYDMELKKSISAISSLRPSYGTRRVRANDPPCRDHCREKPYKEAYAPHESHLFP